MRKQDCIGCLSVGARCDKSGKNTEWYCAESEVAIAKIKSCPLVLVRRPEQRCDDRRRRATA